MLIFDLYVHFQKQVTRGDVKKISCSEDICKVVTKTFFSWTQEVNLTFYVCLILTRNHCF